MTDTEPSYLTDPRDPGRRHRGEIRGLLDGAQPATYEAGGTYAPWLIRPADTPDPGAWWHPTTDTPRTPTPSGPPAHLQPACSCGWRGTPHDTAPDATNALLAAEHAWREHTHTVTETQLTDDDRATLAALRAHLTHTALTRPRAALAILAELDTLTRRTEADAIDNARTHGIAWEDIAADRRTPRRTLSNRHTPRDQSNQAGASTPNDAA